MSNHSADDMERRSQELAQRMLEEGLTDEEHAEWMESLRSNTAARKHHLEQVHLHAMLRELFQASKSAPLSSRLFGVRMDELSMLTGGSNDALSRLDAPPSAGPISVQTARPPLGMPPAILNSNGFVEEGDSSAVSGVSKADWRWLFGWPLRAAAALILIALGGWWFFRGPSDLLIVERVRQPVASLTASVDARWGTGFKPREGATLLEGQLLELTKGTSQISMSCGADLVLKAPCSVVLTSSSQVLLRYGLVNVQVAEWANGFTVATDSVHVVDMGKQFVVWADSKTGAVEAHAIGPNGQLRVLASNVPEEERLGILVSSGEAIRIMPASSTPSRLKADESLFDSTQFRARPFKPLDIHNTGHGLRIGDEDPYWRITHTTADRVTTPAYAVVGKFSDRYLDNEPQLSQWISISRSACKVNAPTGLYTFQTQVDLSGYDLSTITMVAQVIADNGVMAVRLNGRPISFKPWIFHRRSNAFRTFHKIEFGDGFSAGINTIEFDVWNVDNPRHEDNPLALRVEWQAFGCLKSGERYRDASHTAEVPTEKVSRDIQLSLVRGKEEDV